LAEARERPPESGARRWEYPPAARAMAQAPAHHTLFGACTMKNPLDTVSGTIWAGLILTVLLWILVDGILF
jgi:hypothetical protein